MSHQTIVATFADLVGADHVIVGPDDLALASSATFATTQRVAALIRPASVQEVAACMKAASRLGLPLHVASGGKNWGYGSRVPVRDGSILLDLARMKRIEGFDERLAHVTVEPGVTFRDLHSFLEARGSGLMCATPGTSPDASVLGNAVERGLGAGPMGDRFAYVCSLQVVLPTGEIMSTGFSRLPGSRASAVHRWGVGPSLDGLFSQSSFGVVTRMTVWLMPTPKHFVLATFGVADAAALHRVVEGMRFLQGDAFEFRIQNANRARAGTSGRGAVERVVESVALGRPAWYGTAAVYAREPEEAALWTELLRRRLGDAASRLRTWSPDARRWVRRGRRVLEAVGLDVSLIVDAEKSVWTGVPSEASLDSAYRSTRRSRPASGADLDRDGCGIVHFCPVVPLDAAQLVEVSSIVEAVARSHGFEATINMRIVSRRAVDMVCAIHFDRREAGADARAAACDLEWWQRVAAIGYYPYRLGVQSMTRMPPSVDDTDVVVARLKAALDPAGVLARGRYEPPDTV